jgi:hypothetical protein
VIVIVKIIGERGKILPLESMLIYIFDVFVRIYTVPSSFLVDKYDQHKDTLQDAVIARFEESL